MGMVNVIPTEKDLTLEEYPPQRAKPDTFYSLKLKGEQQGPFSVSRREQDGRVSFLLQPPLKYEHIAFVTEFPPMKRIEATDGAFIDNPTPMQAFEFLHHHVTANVTIMI